MADGPVYRVEFNIGPVQTPEEIGVRIAEFIAILKRDHDSTDVEVRITRADRD